LSLVCGAVLLVARTQINTNIIGPKLAPQLSFLLLFLIKLNINIAKCQYSNYVLSEYGVIEHGLLSRMLPENYLLHLAYITSMAAVIK
jgi:hypothetical protein